MRAGSRTATETHHAGSGSASQAMMRTMKTIKVQPNPPFPACFQVTLLEILACRGFSSHDSHAPPIMYPNTLTDTLQASPVLSVSIMRRGHFQGAFLHRNLNPLTGWLAGAKRTRHGTRIRRIPSTIPCLLSGDTNEVKGFLLCSPTVHRNEPCSHFACMFCRREF